MVAQAPASTQPASDGLALSPLAIVGGAGQSSEAFVKKWLNFGGDGNDAAESALVKGYEPAQPVPSDVPLPPRRNAAAYSAAKPQASSKTQSFAAASQMPATLSGPIPGALALAGAPLQQQ